MTSGKKRLSCLCRLANSSRPPGQHARLVRTRSSALLAAALYVLFFCLGLQVELEGRYAATMMLSSHKKDAAASEKRLKEAYENRIRDKQIELHAAVSRLQVCCSRRLG